MRAFQFFYMFALITGSIVFIAFHVAVLANIVLVIVLGSLILRPWCGCLQLTSALILAAFFGIYALHGSYASRSPWLFRIAESLGGRSSCTSHPGVNLPYNAFGIPIDTLDQVFSAATFCPYDDMRFGDNTALPFRGTNEQGVTDPAAPSCTTGCIYASTRAEDYKMNPGRGLTGGWLPFRDVHDTVLCPYMEPTVNELNQFGRAPHIPATCTYAFVNIGHFPAQPRYAEESTPALCIFCPGYLPFESTNVDGLRAFCGWCVFWLSTVILGTVASYVLPRTKPNKVFPD